MVPRIGLADALIMELNKDIKIGYDLNWQFENIFKLFNLGVFVF
jgi:hypothetical protein